jgi:D-3-phosphoglycerate dehydrogenase
MPPNAVVLNFAREGIVDEAAVVAALDAGHLGAYVSDFPVNQTRHHPKCVTLPHLGASTAEAEENCAIMVADQIRDFLEHGNVHNSVNFPEVTIPRATGHRIVSATTSQPGMAGQISDALRKSGGKIQNMASLSRGDLAYIVVDLDAPVPAETLKVIGSGDGVLMIREL